MTDYLIALAFDAAVFALIGMYFVRRQQLDIRASREHTAKSLREADSILSQMKADSPRIEPIRLADGREVTPELLDELYRQQYEPAA